MQFLTIEAVSVGALDDETLELSPGLNVVHGLNEAGKSSWHAALTIGWLGHRRARGTPRAEDRTFVERFAPWSGAPLVAQVTVVTNDGLRYRFRHNLTDLADHRVVDGTGRDVTGQWESDGTADGARLLGLTRQVARATFFVDQADILAVRADPEGLQQHLQRAATSTDRTATTTAAALERLRSFSAEQVGLPRANATKPLRRAIVAAEESRAAFEEAQRAHEAHQSLLAERDAAAARVDQAEDAYRQLRQRVSATLIVDQRREADELAQLQASIAESSTLPEPADEAVLSEVARLRHEFELRPDPIAVDDEVAMLASELASLPDEPVGDLEVHRSVADSWQQYVVHRDRLAQHDAGRPDTSTTVELGGLSPQQVERFAMALEAAASGNAPLVFDDRSPPPHEPLAPLRKESDDDLTDDAAPRPRRTARVVGLLTAVALMAAGGGLIASDTFAAGVTLLATGGLVALISLLLRGTPRRDAPPVVTPTPPSGVPWTAQRQHVAQGAQEALEDAGLGGLGPDELRSLAEQARNAEIADRTIASWQRQRTQLAQAEQQAETSLRQALSARGVTDTESVTAAWAAYDEACRARQQQATKAARRSDLEARMAAAQQLAAERAEREQQRRIIEDRVVARAHQLGFATDGGDPEAADRFLAAWTARQKDLAQRHTALDDNRRDLKTRLARIGRSVEDYSAEIAAKVAEVGDAEPVDDLAAARSRVRELETQRNRAQNELSRLEGAVANAARTLPSVTDAEEAHARALAELDRVRDLERILATTVEHLQRADQHVSQDLAPVLQQAVAEHLPRLTRGRYSTVEVDPRSLAVTVRTSGGLYRPAEHLSHGTAEQIYLLLRIALADHLVGAGVRAPLVLDDVTVQFDEHRTVAFLDLCRRLADQRQIILFTQEREVLEWAMDNLDSDRHQLLRLPDRAD